MNKKSFILPGMISGHPFSADDHLNDGWLLLTIDGELSASEYSLVQEHVRSCWRCRARKEQLKRTIEEIVEYKQALVAPDMPPVPENKAVFKARLNQMAAELGRPSLVRRWTMALLQGCRLMPSSRAVWAISTAVVIALIFCVKMPRKTPVASPSELLHRATVSNSRSLEKVNQSVIVQKLTIKANGHKITRTFYYDTVQRRHAHRADVDARTELAVEQDFQRSSFSWGDPLSAQTFGHWRDGIVDGKDEVTELSGGRLLKLDTTADSGPVAEASLTVREDDYHPVAEGLRLRDNTQIEVAELSYEVVGLSSLSPDIFGGSSTEPIRLPAVSTMMPVRAALPDAAQLAVSELQVRTTLHGIGADLGEQITVDQGADGLVRVDGIAEDESRKRQIAHALMGIPFTEVHLKTIAQAVAYLQPNPAPVDTNPARVTTVAATKPPLLEKQLEQRFPDADQRTEYVNQSLALCQSASARAWALSRLADRYTPAQVALLNTESRKQLNTLLNDHLTALREDINRLQNQLGQVLSSESNTVAANTVSPDTSFFKAAGRTNNWRDEAHRVHSSVDIVNESVSTLLASSIAGKTDDQEMIELNLRTTLTQLQAELQLLDQQISKQL
jgi:hypothetical protein